MKKFPEAVEKTVLDGGVRLVTERVDSALSVALGLWVAAGSRDEGLASPGKTGENGLAHLIEHMVFKGTGRRDKLALAREIDRLGGQTNAFTTKEHTCFHTRVRPEHLAEAVDLMVDIFQNSLYDEAELALEKMVIQQEIAMDEDEPEELAHDLAAAAVWPDHPLGRPVAGTRESVEGLDHRKIRRWLDRHYCGPRLVVSAAGAVDHQHLADLLAARLNPRPEIFPRALSGPVSRAGLTVRRRKLEQAHLVLGSDFPSLTDRRRHAASILSLALGGNMSSRLFQEIRERRGLAYSVYSYYSPLCDAGRLEIYVGAAPDKIGLARRIILKELAGLRLSPPAAEEASAAVDGLVTGLMLGGESMDGRMSRLAKSELIHGRHISLEELLGEIKAVTREDLLALADEFWAEEKLSACLLGPVKKSDFRMMGNFDEA